MAGGSAEPEPSVCTAPSVPSSFSRRATAYQLPSRISVHATIELPPGVTATEGVVAGDPGVESICSEPTRLPEDATRRPTTVLSCCHTTDESPVSSESACTQLMARPSGDRVRVATRVPFAYC